MLIVALTPVVSEPLKYYTRSKRKKKVVFLADVTEKN